MQSDPLRRLVPFLGYSAWKSIQVVVEVHYPLLRLWLVSRPIHSIHVEGLSILRHVIVEALCIN